MVTQNNATTVQTSNDTNHETSTTQPSSTMVVDTSKPQQAEPELVGCTRASSSVKEHQLDLSKWQKLMGPDLLMQTVSTSNGASVQPDDAVQVSLTGYLCPTPPANEHTDDDEIDPATVFQAVQKWWIVIGEKDVLPAVEMAVRFGAVGDTIRVWSHSKFAYGPSTRRMNHTPEDKQSNMLPSESNVCYVIQIHQVIHDFKSAGVETHLLVAEAKKAIGNDIYANECGLRRGDDFGKARAQQEYKRGVGLMEYVLSTLSQEDVEHRSRAKQVWLDCHNNLAALYLKEGLYKQAKEASIKVLEQDPNNFKALIRAAKASLLDPASEFPEVQAALEAAAAQTDATKNPHLAKDLQKLQQQFLLRKRQYQQQSKAMFGNKMTQSSSTNKDQDAETKQPSAGQTPNSIDTNTDTAATQPATEPATTEDTSNDEAATPVEEEVPASAPWWLNRSLWLNRILPYGFQIFMFVAMLQYYKHLLQTQQLEGQQSQSSSFDDEF